MSELPNRPKERVLYTTRQLREMEKQKIAIETRDPDTRLTDQYKTFRKVLIQSFNEDSMRHFDGEWSFYQGEAYQSEHRADWLMHTMDLTCRGRFVAPDGTVIATPGPSEIVNKPESEAMRVVDRSWELASEEAAVFRPKQLSLSLEETLKKIDTTLASINAMTAEAETRGGGR